MGTLRKFLSEYKVTPLAVAFILAIAITGIIQSIVSYLVMPIITFFVPGGAWRNVAFALGPVIIPWGALLSAILTFIIIILVIVWVAKRYVLKEEKTPKK